MPVVPGGSPCVNICLMDAKACICTGCGRTLTEIAGWLSFTANERDTINAALPQRLEDLRRDSRAVA